MPRSVEREITPVMGGGFACAFSILFMIVGPLGLLLLLAYLIGKRPTKLLHGLLFGLAVAGWASVSVVIVPNCGLYLSYPGLWVGMKLDVDGWAAHLVLHAVNFILWPAFGLFLFWVRKRLGGAESRAPIG